MLVWGLTAYRQLGRLLDALPNVMSHGYFFPYNQPSLLPFGAVVRLVF